MQKKVWFISILIFITTALFSLDHGFINDNYVNLRDFPSISNSKIITKMNNDQKVFIDTETVETEIIDGQNNHWYLVTIAGTNTSGWVFGKYLSFDILESSEIISIKRLLRNQYGDLTLTDLFNESEHVAYSSYNASLLTDYTLLESRTTTFWQMKETGYTLLNTYKTDFGELSIFFNPESEQWRFRQIIIKENNISKYFKINVSVDEMISVIGDDFTISENVITYYQDSYWDAYVYEAHIKDNKIESFYLSRYFD